MKKLILLIAAVTMSYVMAAAQGCLPNGISFHTQESIDNFQTNYPGCSVIEGHVGINGNDISNLNGLSVLDSIYGMLIIESNPLLKNLSGLDNLKMIGQNGWGYMMISYNDSLYNFEGLERLKTIKGGLYVSSNPSLASFSGLDSLITIGDSSLEMGDLAIESNFSLTNLSGLENLTWIAGNLRIGVNFVGWAQPNPNLTEISALQNLTSVGQSLIIVYCDSLISLSGLENLNTIGWMLEISFNNSLTSLTGLENIEAGSIGGLSIGGNQMLSSCAVQSICDYLVSPNGEIEIANNAPGCNSPEEVEEACLISIKDNYSEIEISISPNPVCDVAVLSLNGSNSEPAKVCIFNTTGNCLKSWQFNNQPSGTKEFFMDLRGIPAGVYFCRVHAGNEVATRKILKL
jgi:hypothetical protein